MVQYRMLKTQALELLGGSPAAAARAIGVTYQAVNQWPEELPRRIEDRVLAACARASIPIPHELVNSATSPTNIAPGAAGAFADKLVAAATVGDATP